MDSERLLSGRIYRQYSFSMIPLLGQILASDRDSYQYLIESIERFPTQPEFAQMCVASLSLFAFFFSCFLHRILFD